MKNQRAFHRELKTLNVGLTNIVKMTQAMAPATMEKHFVRLIVNRSFEGYTEAVVGI